MANLAPTVEPAPVGNHQQRDSCRDCDPTVNRPADLSGHEAAGQHVDPLQEPDGPEDHQQAALQAGAITMPGGNVGGYVNRNGPIA